MAYIIRTRFHPMEKEPTLIQTWAFLAKATLLQSRRLCQDLVNPNLRRFPRKPVAWEGGAEMPILAESITPLWTADDAAEKSLLAGKIHNLRLALRRLDGLEIDAGGLFSFWSNVGRAHRFKGYVAGRELREGCVVPAIAGGLCQLSNALYDAAARAGLDITERHTHTRVIPGSLAEAGRDATVFWNYLDLRFTSPRRFRIEADMNADSLRVRIRGPRALSGTSALAGSVSPGPGKRTVSMLVPDNCWTCGVTECFRHKTHSGATLEFGKTAFLVDGHWPEYDAYLREAARERDVLALPLDGKRWGKTGYAWHTAGFAKTRSSWLIAALRAWRSRRLSRQGAARQRALLSFHERLAASYASALDFDVMHVTVMQNLLPFLWRDGHLGGRTFDVLMTALPMARLHESLDGASALHPESPTLADFRAPENLVRLEAEALRNARRIITPHTGIAALFPDRSRLLGWTRPSPLPVAVRAAEGRPFTVAFPAATAGRKGAYQLRDALGSLAENFGGGARMPPRLICLGPLLEGKDFWKGTGVRVETQTAGMDWLAEADVAVLPAFIEHRPRRLLQALARGIPVIASEACGLGNLPGIHIVPAGDAEALADALNRVHRAWADGVEETERAAEV
jgi:hypothetical protein